MAISIIKTKYNDLTFNLDVQISSVNGYITPTSDVWWGISAISSVPTGGGSEIVYENVLVSPPAGSIDTVYYITEFWNVCCGYLDASSYPLKTGLLPSYNYSVGSIDIDRDLYLRAINLELSSSLLSSTHLNLYNNKGLYGFNVSGYVTDVFSTSYLASGNVTPAGNYSLNYDSIPAGGYYTDGSGRYPYGTFIPMTGSNIVASYTVNYGTYNWWSVNNGLSGSTLRIKLADYTTDFIVSAYVGSEVKSIYLAPTYIDLMVDDIFLDYVTLSAFNNGSPNTPINPAEQPNVAWYVSQPLSATLLKTASTVYINTSATLPTGDGGDYVKFTSDNSTPLTYTICALIPEQSVVAAKYNFNYDPVVSDSLVIERLANISDFSFLFVLRRLALGESGMAYSNFSIPAVSTIAWDIDPNTSLTALTGLTGLNIDKPYTTVENYNMSAYGQDLIFNQEAQTGIVKSIAQYATATPGDPGTTYVSAYLNTIGGDLLQIITDPQVVANYTLSGYYFNDPQINSTYTFAPLFSTSNVQISALNVKDRIQVKRYELKGVNPYFGQIADIYPTDNILWSINSIDDPLLQHVWAKYPNGVSYTFGTVNQASELDTLIFYVSSRTVTSTPSLSTYTVGISTVDGFTDTYVISAYDYLDESVFDLNFKIINENPRDVNNGMWRLTSVSFNITATDLSYIPNVALGYTRHWDWGDGTSTYTATPTIYHTYTVPSLTTVTIRFSAEDVATLAADGSIARYEKAADDYMDITFVDRFLSATFIAYPTIVFPLLDPLNPISLSPSNYTQTQGVCSYGEGHTAIFNLSAQEAVNTILGGTSYTNTYKWTYGNTSTEIIGNRITNTGTAFSTTPPTVYNPAGTPISLGVYNDIFPTTMVSAHTADNYVPELYPNFKLTDDSSLLTQNARIFPYETPIAQISTYNNEFIIQQDNFIATESLLLPDTSPVQFVSRECVWVISNGTWIDYPTTTSNGNNPAGLNYTFTQGSNQQPGTLPDGEVSVITITLSGIATEKIYNYDFKESDIPFTSPSITISAYVLPDILIYTTSNFVLTGQNVVLQNLSNQSPTGLISAWIYDPGDGNIYTRYDFSSLEITYPFPGTYTLSVSAVANNGFVNTRVYDSMIKVVSEYPTYRSDIFRTYTVSEFELPYSCNKNILIPPNEWVTSDNINAAFDRLDTNFNYISAATKIYSPPPYYYYGWFGQSAELYDISPKWHINILGFDEGVDDGFLTALSSELVKVNDIAVSQNRLYLANDNKVQILSADYNGTIIGETDEKSIGDKFVEVTAIDIDSDERIFVLDAPKNRVVVLDYRTGSINPWRLLAGWGGFGGATAKTKFRNPSDLYVDNNDFVWVVDQGNLVIKKYSRSGGWIATIENNLFTDTNKPISITKDLDNNLHVLTKKYVVKLEEDGTFIKTYTYTNSSNAEPKKIIHHVNDGFIYICLSDKIVRVQKNGTTSGIFSDKNISYNGIYQNSNQDIFITTDHAILKYNEQIAIIDSMLDISPFIWSMDDIYIDEDEYISDWVYNKSLARMWDNIDILRRGLKGKFSIAIEGTTTVVSIRNFSAGEYQILNSLTPKDQVYVGINEFVTADVINRNIKLLCEMLDDILNTID